MAEKPKNQSLPWWNASKDMVHRDIWDTVVYIHNQQTSRMDKNLRSLQLYGNSDLVGASPYNYSKVATTQLPENRVKYNLIASTSDTVCAKISKMKARIQFLTSGGDFRIKKQAQQLTKFMQGLFYHNDIYKQHRAGFRDSTIFDVGALKHYRDGNKIITERVLGVELLTDLADSLYGTPQNLHQVKYYQKDVLKAMYPKFKSDIEASAASFDRQMMRSTEMTAMVAVIESWHLPTPGAKKEEAGRHVISIERATLKDEEHTRNYFPFTFFHWAKPITGFWGQSLAERLVGNQVEINKMLRVIQKSFHLGSSFKVFLEYGSRVAKEHINNDIGSIVYYNGTAPQFYAPQVVHPQYFAHLKWLIEKGYEEAGISQMSATSQKPADLESGAALREYNDIETERFAIISQEYEASFLTTARQYVDLAKEINEEGLDLEVVAESKKFIEKIKWDDIAIEENDYIMQMFPVSMLPVEPAGRLAFVQDLINGQLLPKEYALSLLDFPDIEEFTDKATASIDDINRVLERILDEGSEGFEAPEPFQDLDLGITIMHGAYLDGKNNKVPEDRLELIRQWITAAQGMKDQAVQAAQAQQQMLAGQPPAQSGPQAPAPAVPAQQ